MIIQEDDSPLSYRIKSYSPGKIWINDQCYKSSVIIRPQHLLVPWAPTQFNELEEAHFDSLFDPKVELVLLGTGKQLIIPDMAILRKMYEHGIGVEFMDSSAACRTYSMLASERNVAACILII